MICTLLLGFFCIRYARDKEDIVQRTIGAAIAMIPCLSVCLRMIYFFSIGEYTLAEDLPLHLCRFIALIAPFVMFYKKRFWLGILYFWIFIGTLGANVFPDLADGFPTLEYFLFWTLHSSLLILPFYAILIYKIRVEFKDAWITYIATNLFLALCWIVNNTLGSNYFYTMQKPNTGGLLDFLGDYPLYLITGQGVIIGFILILFLPFLLNRSEARD